MDATRLADLLIKEVSGVDDPANEIPGFMVLKGAWTPESVSKDGSYADPGYQEDGQKRYPLDTEEHIRAAWGYIHQDKNSSKYSAEDLKKVEAKIAAAMKRIGATIEKQSEESAAPVGGIVGKLKGLLAGKEVDVTKEELDAALDAREEGLLKSIGELVSKSVEAPVEGAAAGTETEVAVAAAEAPAAEAAAPALTAEDVAKAVEDSMGPVLEILDKTLDRLAAVEGALTIRKSLDGQETGASGEEPKAPTVSDAIAKAFRRPSIVSAAA